MIFTCDKILKIWDLIICNSNFTILFAMAIISDLKSKLLIMNLNECMSCIRNLEGIIDINSCIYYAGEILEHLPGSFFFVNSLKNKEEVGQYDNQFYLDHPWEIPMELSILEKRLVPYITVFDFLSITFDPIIIDIRNIQEYFLLGIC